MSQDITYCVLTDRKWPKNQHVFAGYSIWGLMDLYLFPNNLLISYGISILLGIIFVFFLDGHRLDDLE